MNIFYPLEGALFLAGKVKTALASSKMRLYKDSLAPDENTTADMLAAAVADYDGYETKTITGWLDPYYDPAGGATIQSGTQQFEYVDGSDHVHNSIGGAWVEDSTGKVLAIMAFDHPVSMARNGDAIPLDVALNYGRAG